MEKRAHLPNIIQVAAKKLNDPVIAGGFLVVIEALERIAAQAMKIDDPRILIDLESIGMLKFDSSEEKAGYLRRIVETNETSI